MSVASIPKKEDFIDLFSPKKIQHLNFDENALNKIMLLHHMLGDRLAEWPTYRETARGTLYEFKYKLNKIQAVFDTSQNLDSAIKAAQLSGYRCSAITEISTHKYYYATFLLEEMPSIPKIKVSFQDISELDKICSEYENKGYKRTLLTTTTATPDPGKGVKGGDTYHVEFTLGEGSKQDQKTN